MSVDPQTDDVMARSPRKLTDRVIDRDMWIDIAFIGIIMAAVTLIGMDMHLEGGLFTDRSIGGTHEFQMIEARTMGFTILVFAQLFNAIASRSARQSAFVGLFSNKVAVGGDRPVCRAAARGDLRAVPQLRVRHHAARTVGMGRVHLPRRGRTDRLGNLQGDHARHRPQARHYGITMP